MNTPASTTGLAILCVSVLSTSGFAPAAPALELLPNQFLLHPGERMHYTAVQRSANGQRRVVDYELASQDATVVRAIEPKGVLEAVRPGRTELVVHTPTSVRRVPVEVSGRAQPPIAAVHHSTVREIVAKELLFVGHANLDGFDHTAVAKPGIDRLVELAKRNRWPVVYWVSMEYPHWYTTDRHPDYAIISEGQEHRIRIDAERVVFTGGSFMFCLLRNAQMTLHGMATHDAAQRITFVFPARAIWVEDLWGPADKRPFPAPMLLLTTLFARREDDAHAYAEVVVPFLDRLITQFPVAGYPPDPPSPPLSELLSDWNVVVRFGDRFERAYKRAQSGKTLLVEFEGI